MSITGVVKTVGQILGGGWVKDAKELIDQHIPDKDLARQLAHDLSELEVTTEHEKVITRINAEKDLSLSADETARTEQVHGNAFVKETRPKIARDSWKLAKLYFYVWAALEIVHYIVALFAAWLSPEMEVPEVPFRFEITVFVGLCSMTAWYMGLRQTGINSGKATPL